MYLPVGRHVVLPPGVVDMNVRDQFESEDGVNHGSREPEESRDGQANIMSGMFTSVLKHQLVNQIWSLT